MNSFSFLSYETQRLEITVGSGAATVANFEMKPLKTNYKEIVENLVSVMSSNAHSLLVIGIVSLLISVTLVSVSCYHKRRRFGNGKFKPSNATSNSGFHRYNELLADNSDQELRTKGGKKKEASNGISPRYTKISEVDNRKLLTQFSEDEEEDDKIFLR